MIALMENAAVDATQASLEEGRAPWAPGWT